MAGLLDSLKRLTAAVILIVVLAATTLVFFEAFIASPSNLPNQLDLLVNLSIVFAFTTVVLYILTHLKKLLTPHLGVQVATVMQFLLMGLTITITALVILGFFNVSFTALIASAGIISITVGLIISTFVGGILSGALIFTTHKLRTDVGQTTIPNSAIASGGVIITQMRLPEPNQEKRLPYNVGDRVVTLFKNEEGTVKEITPLRTIIQLDSGKQLTFQNNAVLTGAVAIAKIA